MVADVAIARVQAGGHCRQDLDMVPELMIVKVSKTISRIKQRYAGRGLCHSGCQVKLN